MRGILVLVVLIIGFMQCIFEAEAQDFYKDKTIRFVVGYSPGGSFDLYTRVIARHFSKHISGNPTTIVESMTGASGIHPCE